MSRAGSARRRELLAELRDAGREHSDATVLWHASVARHVGLHPTDYKTMSLLQRRGPQTAGAIGLTTGLSSASTTALIDRLESRGFARRVRDVSDGRRVLVEATKEGVGALAPFFAAPELSQSRLYEPFSVEELDVIRRFLERSTQRLRAATERLSGPD